MGLVVSADRWQREGASIVGGSVALGRLHPESERVRFSSASVLVVSALVFVACDNRPPAPQVDAAGDGASSSPSLRDDLVPLATGCAWDPSAGMSPCAAFDAFGHKYADTEAGRDRTARACLALVTDVDVKLPAASCVRVYSRKDMREPIIGALEAASDRGVRLELALALKALRVSAAIEPRVIVQIRRGPANDPVVSALLGALHPDDEAKEPSAEAFAVAKDVLLAPPLNGHGAAAGVLERTPSRRAEFCALMGQKVGADVRVFSWEGDWIFPRLTPYVECDPVVAKLLPVLVAAVKAFAEGERPAWGLGNPLHFVGMLEDTRPLKAEQRRALAAALDLVAKKGSEDDKKSAASLAERYRK